MPTVSGQAASPRGSSTVTITTLRPGGPPARAAGGTAMAAPTTVARRGESRQVRTKGRVLAAWTDRIQESHAGYADAETLQRQKGRGDPGHPAVAPEEAPGQQPAGQREARA